MCSPALNSPATGLGVGPSKHLPFLRLRDPQYPPLPLPPRRIAMPPLRPCPQLRVFSAGRTDAGVHAKAQVCQCDAVTDLTPEQLQATLNARLPVALRVRGVAVVRSDFSAMENLWKCYTYTVPPGADWQRLGQGPAGVTTGDFPGTVAPGM